MIRWKRMKQIRAYILLAAMGAGLCVGGQSASADSTPKPDVKPYVSLGADLKASEKRTVVKLLGFSNEQEMNDYEILKVTNQEEHKYLGDYLSKDVIGTRALSSVRLDKGEKDSGISVITSNINYCTEGMYINALSTAGVTDAVVRVAGPFELSGTAALVGAMKAYEAMTGEDLSESEQDAAINELVVTGKLNETLEGNKAEELMAHLKEELIEQGGLDKISDPDQFIDDCAKEVGVTLTDEQREEIRALLDKISGLNLSLDQIKQQADTVYQKLQDMGMDADKASGILAKISDFFSNLWKKISSWFS